MNLVKVRDWFKTIVPGLNTYSIGRFDATIEKVLCFKRGTVAGQPLSMGGIGNTTYSTFAVNMILHWNKNAGETDAKAEEIKETLLHLDHPIIDGKRVVSLRLRNVIPIDVDENGIYEYAIEFEFIYPRN